MKKYTSLIALAALVGTSALAVKAAPNNSADNTRSGADSAQIGQLDKRLSERIAEQQELMGLVERLLHISYPARIGEGDARHGGGALSGQPKPPAPPTPAPAAAKVAPPAPQAPWWQDYQAQMVYLSGNDRYAVVNGKMLTVGQTLDNSVVVERIEADLVALRQGKEVHTFLLKK